MATIEEAIREMRENSLSALVVDDARNPVGIVTLRDMVYGLSDEPD
jgi:CBS domain-containing protein